MSRSFGLDKLAEDVADLYVGATRGMFSQLGPESESEIERLLLTALLMGQSHLSALEVDLCSTVEDVQKAREFKSFAEWYRIVVVRQADVAGWRSDLVIWAARYHVKSDTYVWETLIVECDGHDFHERTKEQAARDRSRDREAQARGFTIFRFTGSEIWRDPLGCAKRIYEWAERAV